MKKILFISFLLATKFSFANYSDTTIKIVKQPLLIVNGKMIPDSLVSILIKEINPRLVENIEVLKDFTALKIYGDSAKNGALIITTKQKDFSPKPFCKPPEYQNDNYTL